MRKLSLLKKWDSLSPYRKLIFGFLVAIFIGVILLKMPFSLRENQNITVIDSLFTIVSAICVTGLSVVDVSQVFTSTGQLIILFFIQLGGLGVMTVSIIVFLLVGKKMSFETRELLKEERNSNSNGGITKFIKQLLLTVFVIEISGASILTYGFSKYYSLKRSIFYGLFHSVSAFCNAGFSLFSDNLSGFKNSFLINMTIPLLIFLGGIGFSTILNCYNVLRKKEKKLTLTTKLSIGISVFLVIIGMIAIFIFEYSNKNTIGNLPFTQKLEASFFQSVTTRTAGFNTVSISGLKRSTSLLFIILMFIGASPGSTGGGIKTTTIGLIILGIFATLKNKDIIEYDKRCLSWRIYRKAIAILFISLIYTSVCVFLLILIEKDKKLLDLAFEVYSAFGTVGLSRDLTPSLMSISKFILIVTMFVGRVGPLTIALALSKSKIKKGHYTYPQENILIG